MARMDSGASTTRRSILLIDGEHVLGLPVIHALNEGGFDVHLLCAAEHGRTRLSRYVKSLQVKPAGATDAEELARITEALKISGAAVALPVGSAAFAFCARFRDELSKIAALPPAPDAQSIFDFTSKRRTAQFCSAHRIPHPATICFDSEDEMWPVVESLPFPILLKPNEGTASKGIERANSVADVRRIFRENKTGCAGYVFQQIVDGFDIDCSVLCVNGEVISSAIQRRPESKGPAPLGIFAFVDHLGTLELARRTMKAANFSGVAHLDCRVDKKTGVSYLLEVNPRFWGSLIGAVVAGANFPAAMARLALNEPPNIPPRVDLCFFAALRNLPAFLPNWLFGSDPAFARRPFRSDWKYVLRDPVPFIGGALGRYTN